MLQDFISSMIQNNNIISNILTAVMSQILFLFFVNLHIFFINQPCVLCMEKQSKEIKFSIKTRILNNFFRANNNKNKSRKFKN